VIERTLNEEHFTTNHRPLAVYRIRL